ncbi:SulP family inorganic anion transporter [Terasakiispira papahanaumokuakeensis]|uniref:SulP family inorganic anion transporter n=1 Tax=Terasakiispira papahanaumokuakeensis TaxID=197479 RepID=UPI000B183DC8|nr:sulfate permease [Terasakiispira papahanaumokuakeensis]
MNLSRYLPVLKWGRHYSRQYLLGDVSAAIMVILVLIPQALAYALLAGLPAEVGLYAALLPAVLYALLGTSPVLAVGPVAIVSLMTASAIGQFAAPDPQALALTLALLSGVCLLLMGLLRLGALINFLSYPVLAGFTSASSLLIAANQLPALVGMSSQGHTFPALVMSLWQQGTDWQPATATLGGATLVGLWSIRRYGAAGLSRCGVSSRRAGLIVKLAPALAVIVGVLCVKSGLMPSVALVGAIPDPLPTLTLPPLSWPLLQQLWMPAFLIAVIGFISAIAVAQTLAMKQRQRVDPDQELIALGVANIGASFSGGYPVSGSLARSAVNYEVGAQTAAAGAFTALGLVLGLLVLTPWLAFLPKTVLAATIIVAVLSLVDVKMLITSWHFARDDFIAVAATFSLTLLFGLEAGIVTGAALSIGLFLWHTARPHIAEVGRVPGTQHFRNRYRYRVQTDPTIVMLRPDESLYFANARFLEQHLYDRVVGDAQLRHVVLLCSAVNDIDLSALNSLAAMNLRLKDLGMQLHLAEVKGPVMSRLKRSDLLDVLSGQVFLSAFEAMSHLASQPFDDHDQSRSC